MRHCPSVSSSKRLQCLLDILIDGQEHSTFELQSKTLSCAVHSDVADLRANGYNVIRSYKGKSKTGRQINTYKLIKAEELTEVIA